MHRGDCARNRRQVFCEHCAVDDCRRGDSAADAAPLVFDSRLCWSVRSRRLRSATLANRWHSGVSLYSVFYTAVCNSYSARSNDCVRLRRPRISDVDRHHRSLAPLGICRHRCKRSDLRMFQYSAVGGDADARLVRTRILKVTFIFCLVVATRGILGYASHCDAASVTSCSPNVPRIYVLGDDLGQRAAGASADRALYLYCGTNTSPALSLTQHLKPYVDGLDYDERGHVYVGVVANGVISWLAFDGSGRLVVESPPLPRVEDWAVNRAVGTMYAVTTSDTCPKRDEHCKGSSFSLEAMAPSLSRVLRRVPLALGASAGSVSNSPSGLTFDRRGRFYLKYGNHVFAFGLQSGRLIRAFRIGSGAWTVANGGLFVSNGMKLSEYDLRDFRLVRTVDLLPQKMPFPKIAVTSDGTVYILDGQRLDMYVVGRPASRLAVPFNGIDASLALDRRNNLYVLVPHNSAFSGNQVASTPGVYLYRPRSNRPVRIYDLPPLAVTWSASSMVLVPSENALARRSAVKPRR